MTQRALAAGWVNVRTGKPYSHTHVQLTVAAFGKFTCQPRPRFRDAYNDEQRAGELLSAKGEMRGGARRGPKAQAAPLKNAGVSRMESQRWQLERAVCTAFELSRRRDNLSFGQFSRRRENLTFERAA